MTEWYRYARPRLGGAIRRGGRGGFETRANHRFNSVGFVSQIPAGVHVTCDSPVSV